MHGRRNGICSKLTSAFLRKWWCVIALSVLLLILGIVIFIFFMTWVNLVIHKEIVLRNGSMTFDWWREPPVEPVMSVYIYNVTNADAFLNNGDKPILEELGPFVYRQHWQKVNLTFNENNTLTFNQQKIFEFDELNSAGSEEDMVVVPNIPMLSATSQSKNAARFLRLAMASIMDILKIKPFVEVSVAQLLWGYDDPLLKLAKEVTNNQTLPYDEFGLLYGKNGTSKDNVTIFTGAGDFDNITLFGLIDNFNGHTHLKHWKTEECNRLNGSDGSVFPPHITKNTMLHVYDKDLCRLLPLRFEKEVETNGGVMGYRFTPPDDVFAEVSQNPDNECFCPGGPPCTPHGLFNVSLCQYDSPVMLSFPHFYLADPKFLDAVEGVSKPEKEKHGFYLDVQPDLGVSLRARARIQINLAVSQVTDIKQVATFPDIMFPIMWFEDGIDGLPPDVTDLLYLAATAPPIARSTISFGLIAIGALLLLIAAACLWRSSKRQETLHLEGTSHYVKPSEKQKKEIAANGHPANGNGKTFETLNPAFLTGPDNGTTN